MTREEKEEAVRRLARQGFHCNAIARQLGLTKCAVRGIAHRVGIRLPKLSEGAKLEIQRANGATSGQRRTGKYTPGTRGYETAKPRDTSKDGERAARRAAIIAEIEKLTGKPRPNAKAHIGFGRVVKARSKHIGTDFGRRCMWAGCTAETVAAGKPYCRAHHVKSGGLL